MSKGKFQGLCLRFADDFETNLDDWKPNSAEPIMNVCVVSEGTFEVCSRTTAAKKGENAKWLLNVKWQMEGVDIHLDVNIGKQLSSLGHTLTMLTGFEEDETQMESPDSDEGDQSCRDTFVRRRGDFDNLPAFVFDPTIDSKKRSFMMEKEMAEQLKIINDLRTLGASHNTVAHEERRLQELQAICYKYFRRDMIQKWKRPSLRRSLKTYGRSHSYIGSGSSVSGVGVPQTLDNVSYTGRRLDTIASNDEISSLQSTPASCHSRSASLKHTTGGGVIGGGVNALGRVTFTEAMRQTSLPNADTDTETADNELDWRGDITPSEIDVDGTSVEMRRKHGHGQKQPEPNIDFELDIKVLVNSGKCVLHTKDTGEERGYAGGSGAATSGVPASSVKSHKREKSIGNDWGSPTPSRRQRDKSKLRYNANALLADLTIFHIPGLDVKLHYQSKTLAEQLTGDQLPTGRRMGSKRATLCAWMTLQSIPEETIISPHILEFLEQTLEPIPARQSSSVPPTPSHNTGVNLDILPANYVSYASFPVDVIVYFHMQPSTFRFSCLPVSRVECMLQLPSLDIVFSSKRSSEEENSAQPGGHTQPDQQLPTGGLSVTGCLADFNVFIFHPYGGKKTSKETQFSPLSDSERKDSLSINVEFVKFHITRCRKVYIEPLPSSKRSLDQSRAVIRFSTIVDIGSASFKYDMRRLTEILAFPKAWYRRRIVRRLFLGDLSVQQQQQQQQGNGAETPTGCPPATPTPNEDASRAKDNMRLDFDGQPSQQQQQLGHFGAVRHLKNLGKSSSAESSGTPPSEKNQITAWETLVIFAVNFTKLNVQMNIGNVCGNVVWLTKDFQSDGRLSIGSTGYKNMYAGIYLGGSALDAKGGIVGGSFEVNKINKRFHIKEEAGMEPYHTMGLSFMALELRLDYMGTSVLMTRISSFSAAMKDEWRTASQAAATPAHGKDQPRALIFIHGDLTWDQLQIMISKSTTADLLKMYFKLEEFFTQQFKSSKRVFSNLEPRLQDRTASIKRRQQHKKKPANGELVAPPQIHGMIGENTDARHHRHWQKPLAQAVGLVVPSLVTRLPRHGNVLGGTVELRGQNISLACFHGINFKSKSWALFSLRSPSINFATEARQSEDEVLVTQTLTSSLGQTTEVQQQQNHSMAIVSRITRNIIFPPQFKTLNEWFHYAFANSEIDGKLIRNNAETRLIDPPFSSHQQLWIDSPCWNASGRSHPIL